MRAEVSARSDFILRWRFVLHENAVCPQASLWQLQAHLTGRLVNLKKEFIVMILRNFTLALILITGLSACAISHKSPPDGFSSWHQYWQHQAGHRGSNNRN